MSSDGGEVDRRWMERALVLARRGEGATRPNPMVGAVVVRGKRVLGEGYHRRAGTPHAEINALEGLGGRAAGATLYVTLEPCCHVGRTAPCTTAVIAAGIARVVVGARDPNPLVNGLGIARLRRAGVRVDVGCLEAECRALNRAFFTWIGLGRPFVTLKAAASLDGFIAGAEPVARRARRGSPRAPVWITGAAARAAAHELRGRHDAILVGAGTVIADDPRLTVRLPRSRRPRAAPVATTRATEEAAPTGSIIRSFLRVILDGRLRIPTDAAVLAADGGARTLVVGAVGAPASRVDSFRRAGAEVALLRARDGRIDLQDLLSLLAERQVQSLLVEGGAAVHAAFIAAGLVDRVALFYAPMLLGGGVPIAERAIVTPGARTAGRGVADALKLGPLEVRPVGDDLLVEADVLH